MAVDDSDRVRQGRGAGGQTLPFFSLVHWGRLFFLAVLAVVLLATAGRTLWHLVQPTEAVTGVIEGVEENRISNRAATYGLSLRTNEDALAFIRLRNNGRILTYLLAQERLPDSRVIVRHRQGTAVELSFLDGATPAIRESAAPPAVSLLVLLPGLVVFLLLARPGVVERRWIR